MNTDSKKAIEFEGIAILTILTCVLCLYGRSILFPFVLYDDDLHLYRNPILSATYIEALKYFWRNPYRGFFIPITYSVWATLTEWVRPNDVTRSLMKMNPWVFHAANVVFHTLNSLLVYFLLKKFLKNKKAVLIATLLFVLHPVQVESVAWATGLKELLSGFFALLALLSLFSARNAPFQKRGICLFGYVLFYLLGLLSKPGIIPVPLLAWGILFLNRQKTSRLENSVLGLSLVLALPLVFFTAGLQPPEKHAYITPLFWRPLVAIDALSHCLFKTIFPIGLTIEYGRTPEYVLNGNLKWILALFWLAGTIVLYRLKRSYFWALGLAIVSLSPVLGLVRFAFQDFSTVADHYMYLFLGLLSLGVGIVLENTTRLSIWISACVVLMTLFCLSFIQLDDWQDSTHLLSKAIKLNSRSLLSRNNLAVQAEDKGDYLQALDQYLACAQIKPNHPQHHYNAGNVLLKLSRWDEAKQELKMAVSLDPTYGDAYFNLGLLAEGEGQYKLAEQYFRLTMEYLPLAAKGLVKLSQILMKRGEVEHAHLLLERAIEVEPFSSQAHFALGKFLAKFPNHRQEAVNEMQIAVKLNPQSEDPRRELENLK